MRRLLTAVIAVLVTLAGATAAHADPGSGSTWRCAGYRWVTPDIEADTCTRYYFWDYGREWKHDAWVMVRNHSQVHPVTVWSELIVNGQVGFGTTKTVPPGSVEIYTASNALHKAPDGTRVQARGYLSERSWNTHIYAPGFP